jgi:hypothetical protein
MHWWIPKRQRRYARAAEVEMISLPFPEHGAEIISFGENGALANVETVGESVKVKEATSKL